MRTRSRFASPTSSARVALTALIGLCLVAGCSEEARFHEAARPGRAGVKFETAPASTPPPTAVTALERGSLEQTPGAGNAGATPAPRATANRKIIYDTSVVLVTEDLDKLDAGLHQVIETQGAFVADSDRQGSTGPAREGQSTREGHWKIRVPVETYDALVRGILGLGELVSTKAKSQDVTAEFFDLDARTASKKVEEARLLKHLTDSTGKLDEILTVERELSRVRGEIERMQGQLAVLGNLTTLATVTVTASEIKGYTPPAPPPVPTLGQKVATTFNHSLASFESFCEVVLLAAVALTPWLPLLILSLLLVWFIARRSNTYLGA